MVLVRVGLPDDHCRTSFGISHASRHATRCNCWNTRIPNSKSDNTQQPLHGTLLCIRLDSSLEYCQKNANY